MERVPDFCVCQRASLERWFVRSPETHIGGARARRRDLGERRRRDELCWAGGERYGQPGFA